MRLMRLTSISHDLIDKGRLYNPRKNSRLKVAGDLVLV